MSTDRYSTYSDSAESPSTRPYAVVPSDTAELPEVPKAIYVGTGGDVTLRGVNGAADVTFRNVPSGMTLDVRAVFIRATGTTAADLVAFA